MRDGPDLDFDELGALVADLDTVLTEFDEAASVRKGLEDAVGRPDDRGELREKVGDFEDCWNNTRDDLREGISKVRDHLQAIVDGFQKADEEMAMPFDNSGQELVDPTGQIIAPTGEVRAW